MRSFVPVRSIGAVLQKEGGDRLQVVRHDECARRQSIESATNLAKEGEGKKRRGLGGSPRFVFLFGVRAMAVAPGNKTLTFCG